MYRVLAIDGGGIRGVIPATWLQLLEERLGSPLSSHFDLIAGTSTGSILAAGIAAGIDTKRLFNLYKERGAQIFPPRPASQPPGLWRTVSQWILGPKYSDEPLADVLREHFIQAGARSILMGELRTNCLIVAYDVLNRRVRLLRSWKDNHRDVPVWEAVKASCSAPTYFAAHVMRLDGLDTPLIDGGVVANNPASLAVAEAISLNASADLITLEKVSDLLVVSLGTGNLTKSISVAEATQWGGIQWAFPIIDVVFDGNAGATDYICRAILKNDRYRRLQVDLKAGSEDIDDATVENIESLAGDARRYAEEGDGRAHLDEIVAMLMSEVNGIAPVAEVNGQIDVGGGGDNLGVSEDPQPENTPSTQEPVSVVRKRRGLRGLLGGGK